MRLGSGTICGAVGPRPWPDHMSAATTVPSGTPKPDVADGSADRTDWLSAIPFFAVHLVPLAAFFVAVTWQDWVLCAVLVPDPHVLHHRRLPPLLLPPQLPDGQGAAVPHGLRRDHRLPEGPAVVGQPPPAPPPLHRPRRRRPLARATGFWWSHVGWILSTKYKATDLAAIKDFAAYPELRLLDRLLLDRAVAARPAPASSSAVGAACSSASSSPPSCCGTAPSWSTRWPTSWGGVATPPRTPAATRWSSP